MRGHVPKQQSTTLKADKIKQLIDAGRSKKAFKMNEINYEGMIYEDESVVWKKKEESITYQVSVK